MKFEEFIKMLISNYKDGCLKSIPDIRIVAPDFTLGISLLDTRQLLRFRGTIIKIIDKTDKGFILHADKMISSTSCYGLLLRELLDLKLPSSLVSIFNQDGLDVFYGTASEAMKEMSEFMGSFVLFVNGIYVEILEGTY